MRYSLFGIIFMFCCASAQTQPFTYQDTLRGSNGPGRNWWDAAHYGLNVDFDIRDSTIRGFNKISFKVVKKSPGYFQIDLQSPLIIDSVFFDWNISEKKCKTKTRIHKDLQFSKLGDAWFIKLDASLKSMLTTLSDTTQPGLILPSVTVFYHGKPRVSTMPPWDGGVVWSYDKQDVPFIGVACQGLGASVWYPCKDYQGDEPDSASMTFTAPDSLMVVSNGRMRDSVNNGNGTHTITWAVKDPINNYDISPYIGKYTHFGQDYDGVAGNLTMDYWVLDSNLARARVQFRQAPMMMKAFEYWFGPYPFYKDGYKLVEAPYLGMEHQSAIAYGNHYENGYLGKDLSGTGWGLKWDFIIIHESGHEWFGNNITTKDVADMWVHEGFANYSEALYTEYYYGKKAADAYVIGLRKNIRNDKPVIGQYGVNNEGSSSDMYYKASNMVHMIRQIVDDDTLFRAVLQGLNRDFRHQTVTGRQVEQYINEKTKRDFDPVFKQYLETTKVPVLEYLVKDDKLIFRWTNCVDGFNMPLRVYNDQNELVWIYPVDNFQAMNGVSRLRVDDNFYINTREIQRK